MKFTLIDGALSNEKGKTTLQVDPALNPGIFKIFKKKADADLNMDLEFSLEEEALGITGSAPLEDYLRVLEQPNRCGRSHSSAGCEKSGRV